MNDIRVYYFDYQKLAGGMLGLLHLTDGEAEELMTFGKTVCLVALGREYQVDQPQVVFGVSSVSLVRVS